MRTYWCGRMCLDAHVWVVASDSLSACAEHAVLPGSCRRPATPNGRDRQFAALPDCCHSSNEAVRPRSASWRARVLTLKAISHQPSAITRQGRVWSKSVAETSAVVKHFFDIDLEYSPHRGGEELKIFSPTMVRPDIENFLRHLGLDRCFGPEKPLCRRPLSRGAVSPVKRLG